MNDSCKINNSQEAGVILDREKTNYLELFKNLSKPVILFTGDYKLQEINSAAVELFRGLNSMGADGCGENEGLEKASWLTEEVKRFQIKKRKKNS